VKWAKVHSFMLSFFVILVPKIIKIDQSKNKSGLFFIETWCSCRWLD